MGVFLGTVEGLLEHPSAEQPRGSFPVVGHRQGEPIDGLFDPFGGRCHRHTSEACAFTSEPVPRAQRRLCSGCEPIRRFGHIHAESSEIEPGEVGAFRCDQVDAVWEAFVEEGDVGCDGSEARAAMSSRSKR